MDSFYLPWNESAKEATLDPNWKRNNNIHHMLEHLPGEHAIVYIKLCKEEGLTDTQIQAYADMCDSVGNPDRNFYSEVNLTFSPTSMRYLYHATQILKANKELPIVELGAGYGGLALAINYVSTLWNKLVPVYIIIDLPGPKVLQNYYLNKFNIKFPVHWSDGKNLPACFFVSNYALAEIGENDRAKYISYVFDSVVSGFMVWNSGASFEFLSKKFDSVSVEDEYPQTGHANKVIRF
jgi:hypothetical protein